MVWYDCDCDVVWSDGSAFDYASHSEYYDDTDSDDFGMYTARDENGVWYNPLVIH